MDKIKFQKAKDINKKIEAVKEELSNLNFLLSVLAEVPEKSMEKVDLKYIGTWRNQSVDIHVPRELYETALLMVKKNYLDKLAELEKEFEKI